MPGVDQEGARVFLGRSTNCGGRAVGTRGLRQAIPRQASRILAAPVSRLPGLLSSQTTIRSR